MRHVALLRGINIGGRNKISMGQLKVAMEQTGFDDVSTYINSGNIFFTSNHDSTLLTQKLETVIADEFKLNIKVLLRTKPSIEAVVGAIPEHWTNDRDHMKCDVMFLWEHYDNPSVLEKIHIRDGIDTVSYVDGAIIWMVDRKNQTKSGMMKLAGTDLYQHMTIRNVNTARKLLEFL